jgi:hypothetical protein
LRTLTVLDPLDNRLARWRVLAAATAVGVVVTACGTDVGTTPTAPAASEPAATGSAALSGGVLPIGENPQLGAGSYSLSDFPVEVSFDIRTSEPPAVWFPCSPSAVEQAVCYSSSGNGNDIVALTFQIVDNVVAGCSDQETAELLDPPVGPSVDDLVDAISNLEGYEATAPEDISMSGFDGKEFTLTATGHCGATWATADRVTGMGNGEINLLQVLDVDGERVLIATAYNAATPEEDLAIVQEVRDSARIEP